MTPDQLKVVVLDEEVRVLRAFITKLRSGVLDAQAVPGWIRQEADSCLLDADAVVTLGVGRKVTRG